MDVSPPYWAKPRRLPSVYWCDLLEGILGVCVGGLTYEEVSTRNDVCLGATYNGHCLYLPVSPFSVMSLADAV